MASQKPHLWTHETLGDILYPTHKKRQLDELKTNRTNDYDF